jgi:hypothetical protein
MSTEHKPSGMEMMALSMLKTFMPKEAADQLLRMASDGTFDRIAQIPKALDEINARLTRIEQRLSSPDKGDPTGAIPTDNPPRLLANGDNGNGPRELPSDANRTDL